ncbi:MAG: hypothetical protein ACLPPF_13620 [Rhodomicrobium sp.]
MKKLIIIAFALIMGAFVSGMSGRANAAVANPAAVLTQADVAKSETVHVWYRRWHRRYYYHYYYRPRYYRYYYYRPYWRHRYYRRHYYRYYW